MITGGFLEGGGSGWGVWEGILWSGSVRSRYRRGRRRCGGVRRGRRSWRPWDRCHRGW